MSIKDSVVIAGGGIGGLTAALALGQKGWTVRVLEREPYFGAIGYGIQLGPNVFPIFAELGIFEAVLANAISPGNLWMLDAYSGTPILRVPTGKRFLERYKAPYIVIHRADLHRVLLSACASLPTVRLIQNADLIDFASSDDRVVAVTLDGRKFEGDLLIGADGLRSRVRERLIGTSEPDPTGYVAHRSVVPIGEVGDDFPRSDVILWAGDRFHMVNYPLRNHTVMNIVAVFETQTYADKGGVAEYRSELQRTYRDAHPAMRRMIEVVNLERRWPIGDRPPQRGWSKGRVVMIGDAAHAALQSLAQGACMAIEDAALLATLLDSCGADYSTAFQSFESLRLLRTARVQLEGRYMWDTFYHTSALEAEVRNNAQRQRDEDDIYRCLDWLYLPQRPDQL